MANEVTSQIGTDDFKRFAKALLKAAPEAKSAISLELRAMGQKVAEDARGNVEPYSTTIPDTIQARMNGASMVISASGPIAGLFEAGNMKNGHRSLRPGDMFNHPVFGNAKVWVDQQAHPFLQPAIDENQGEIDEALDRAITRIVEIAAKD